VRAVGILAVLAPWLLLDPARAADRPIDGVKLVLKRTASAETLVFVSRDPDTLFPAMGSADDPRTGTPGGMSIDLFSAGEGAAGSTVPSGLGWSAAPGPPARYRFRNGDAPAGPSPVRLVLLKEGRVLKVAARTVGLPMLAPQETVGIRVTTGTLRSCARFDAASVRKDVPGKFIAKGALAAVLADCSDASLGGGTPATSTTATSTTSSTTLAPCALIPDPFEPMCGGACPAGSRCVAEFSPQLAPECVCLPDELTPCLDSGYPACGGGCGGTRTCQGFRLLPGELPAISGCACAEPTDTCDDPVGTCFALGVCPPGSVCVGSGPPQSVCGCGAP
jgi:hypothetical protein